MSAKGPSKETVGKGNRDLRRHDLDEGLYKKRSYRELDFVEERYDHRHSSRGNRGSRASEEKDALSDFRAQITAEENFRRQERSYREHPDSRRYEGGCHRERGARDHHSTEEPTYKDRRGRASRDDASHHSRSHRHSEDGRKRTDPTRELNTDEGHDIDGANSSSSLRRRSYAPLNDDDYDSRKFRHRSVESPRRDMNDTRQKTERRGRSLSRSSSSLSRSKSQSESSRSTSISSSSPDSDQDRRRRKRRRHERSRSRSRSRSYERKRRSRHRKKDGSSSRRKHQDKEKKGDTKRSVLTGKKIKLKVKKDKGDEERDAKRKELLKFLNSTFE